MNYLVITIDNDNQCDYIDVIRAESADAALEFVMAKRPYVVGGRALDANDLREYANILETCRECNTDNAFIIKSDQEKNHG